MIEIFRNKIIGVDTSPFIYFLEKKETYLVFLKDFFRLCSEGAFEIVTSSITLAEILVNPYKNKNEDIAESYLEILENSKGLRIINIDIPISKQAAKLRSNYSIRTPDALQISAAINSNADYFLTNDKDLKKIKEIEVLFLEELIKQN